MSDFVKPFPTTAREILPPTKKPDGWCYVRMPRKILTGMKGFYYADESANDRVISARKAEEGAEVMDFLKLVKARDAYAVYDPKALAPDTWEVGGGPMAMTMLECGQGKTLRAAYFDFCKKNRLEA